MTHRAWGLARSLLIYHARPFRQARLRTLLAEFVAPGALVFDVGAHVGNRVRALRRLGARVVAVEPLPSYAGLLRKLFAREPYVTIAETAIGERAGEAVFYVSDRHPTVSTLSALWRDRVAAHADFSRVAWNREIQVAVATLDALIAQYGEPAYIKLDIEGSEAAALRGLSHPVPALSFEYVPGALDEALECVALMGRLGRYRYNWSPGETMGLAAPDWLDEAGMRSFLASPAAALRSGDIYCRRVA